VRKEAPPLGKALYTKDGETAFYPQIDRHQLNKDVELFERWTIESVSSNSHI
jgi:hypothetical protein